MNIIGHRGASQAEPENTPAAFRAAERMGADGIELDVRIAAVGRQRDRLVVCHDPLPTSPRELDALADLDESLDACGDRMLVNVEIKNSEADGGHDATMAVVAPTIDALRRRSIEDSDRWLISSFSLATLDHCRLVAPEIATALLTSCADGATIEAAISGGHGAVNPWERHLTAEQVDDAHAAGLRVNAWTCNDPDRLIELRNMGVDGVCTDVPDQARTALGRDGDPPVARPSWT